MTIKHDILVTRGTWGIDIHNKKTQGFKRKFIIVFPKFRDRERKVKINEKMGY